MASTATAREMFGLGIVDAHLGCLGVLHGGIGVAIVLQARGQLQYGQFLVLYPSSGQRNRPGAMASVPAREQPRQPARGRAALAARQ